jgi:glycine/D-amino acid oxidase-like deaminating enzyme
MSRLPEKAGVVVIGAGIVGNPLACHLSRLAWSASTATHSANWHGWSAGAGGCSTA